MDIVDLGTRDQEIPGSSSRVYLSRLITAERAAASLLIIGFVLVFVAQMVSWFSVQIQPSGFDAGPFDSVLTPALSIADSETAVQIPYYLVWLVLFGCCGAAVFAPRARRGSWLGGAAGALAAQIVIIAPIIKRPQILDGGLLSDIGSVGQVTHAAGSYCVISALAIIALGLILGIYGSVVRPTNAASVHPIAAHSVVYDPLDVAPPSAIPVQDFDVVRYAADYTSPAVDHSLYVRPPETPPGA